MKYTTEIIINLPRQQTVALFDDPTHLKQWQPTLQHMEHLSGEPGQNGSQSKLTYDMGGRTVVMTETVVNHDLPDTVAMTFETQGVHNKIVNHFTEINDNQTKWVMENEFQFSGFMAILAIFIRGSFPKETRQSMERFKAFAEQQA